jgi:hypothetical protein
MLAGSLATVLAKLLQELCELSLAELEDMLKRYSNASVAATRIVQEAKEIPSLSVSTTMCILLSGCLLSTRFKKCDMLCFC